MFCESRFDVTMAAPNEWRPLQPDSASPQRNSSILGRAFVVFLVIAAVSLIGLVVLPSPNGGRGDSSPRVKCASNLRQIGQAILLYGNDHQGQYPDSFATILLNEDITSDIFVCPDSNDTAAVGPTTQAAAANLSTPEHCSYVYIGSNFNTATVPSNAVVAYEPLSNHANTGMNVLFGDGRVEFVNSAAAGLITAKVSARAFPVTMPTN